MKKVAMIGASAVLAALPVVGVFAAGATQTDVVEVTVSPSCSMTATGAGGESGVYKATVSNGRVENNITGSTLAIACNDAKGWELSAVGSGSGETVNAMDASTNNPSDDITSNATLSESTSAWAFKAKGSDGAIIQESYENFSVVPTDATIIAKGSTPTDSARVVVTYGVSISSTQAAGTYTGKVTYTLSHPASE